MQTRSLSLDLAFTDLADPGALTRLVAAHCLAPARRAWRLPDPDPAETPRDVRRHPVERAGRIDWEGRVPELEVSTAHVDPVLRGFVLFGRLFPGGTLAAQHLDTSVGAPGWIYFDDSRELATLVYADVARLCRGLLGLPDHGAEADDLGHTLRPARNDAALAELREAKAMVTAALAAPAPAEPPLHTRRDIGLRIVDRGAAWAIDEILRAEARQRLVWLAGIDLLFPLGEVVTLADGSPALVAPSDDEFDDGMLESVDEAGVYPTVLPETIRAAVVLDLVATFSRDRTVADCGYCGMPMLLTPHRAGRVDHGEPVYHDGCHAEHRRRWGRDYRRRQRTSRGGRPASTLDDDARGDHA